MNVEEFSKEWIDAWNSHNLERILSHYSEDFEIVTPMIKIAMGIDTGALIGKKSVRDYWSTALQKFPDLHFELKNVTEGIDSVAICYESSLGKIVIEVMFFDHHGKINKAYVHYS